MTVRLVHVVLFIKDNLWIYILERGARGLVVEKIIFRMNSEDGSNKKIANARACC